MRFEQWLSFHRKQKPQLMRDVHEYMNTRYDFSGAAIPGVTMSGGKPIMLGPVARLPDGIESFEQLAALTAAEIRERDLFPYKPLAHPLPVSRPHGLPAVLGGSRIPSIDGSTSTWTFRRSTCPNFPRRCSSPRTKNWATSPVVAK